MTTNISIIGSGNMAATIGARAAEHGYAVEIIGRDPAKAQAIADHIGDGATVGEFGMPPAGEIVVLAVLYQSVVAVVTHFGDSLTGKTLVDITNPFNADVSGLVTTPGSSMSEQIADAAPADAQVVKAINTILRSVLADDRPVDAFLAGDDLAAKARVATFLHDIGTRPLDAGGLHMAHALEWAGVLLVGIASNGAGFDTALGATTN